MLKDDIFSWLQLEHFIHQLPGDLDESVRSTDQL
jgi:hypothetical protein